MGERLRDEARLKAELDGLPRLDAAAELTAAVAAGASLGGMVSGWLAASRGSGGLSPAEYLYYRLWEPRYDAAARRRFVGKRAQARLHHATTAGGWKAIADDKMAFHAFAAGQGLPIPRMAATINAPGRLEGVPNATGPEAVARLLSSPRGAWFAKPVRGIYSIGTELLGPASMGAMPVGAGDGVEAVSAVAARLASRPGGYVVQERLSPSGASRDRFGDGLCSVRAVTLLGRSGASVLRAVLKLPAPGNAADNFWRPGNMLAAIDVASGTALRAIRGVGRLQETGVAHPATGKPIEGWQVPGWDALVGTLLRATESASGLGTQSWDVALSSDGPVLMEVNWGGDLSLPQLAYGEGMMTPAFAAHLVAHGATAW